jgi:hypothetical protein
MKTMFAVGFQVSQNVWDRRTVSGTFLGQARPKVLGETLSSAQIDQYTAKIANGRQKLAQLRKWIASRIDADPMLARTFNDAVVQKNFWDFDDIVTKDQWYVDQTEDALRNPPSADYDIPTENLGRTDEWAQVIDNMVWGMNEYGKVPLTTTPITGVRPAIKPGAKPGNPLATVPETKILGVPQGQFVLGAGVVAIGGILAYALLT